MGNRFTLLILSLLVCRLFGQTASDSGVSSNSNPNASSVQPAQTSASPTGNSLSEADALLKRGRYREAGQLYQAALQATPPVPVAYAGLARTYLKQEQVALAHQAAQKGLEALPSSSIMHSALGDVFFREGKIPEAESEYAKAQQIDISNPRAWYGRSRVYRSISMYKHAYDYLEKAHQLDPGDPDIQSNWFGTLRLSEQVAQLERSLAASSAEESTVREQMQRRLGFLKQRLAQPSRSCKLAKQLPQTETSLDPMMIDPQHIRGWGLKVSLNGNASHLLIDTGASGILINSRAAERAGIVRVTDTKLYGIGDKGAMTGYVGYADSIKIGALEFQDCLVEVSDKRTVTDEDGLIGADVFSSYLVTLDFPDHRLRLTPLPVPPDEKSVKAPELKTHSDFGEAGDEGDTTNNDTSEKSPRDIKPRDFHDRYVAPEMQSYTKIFRFGHDLLIPTKVGDAPPKLFLIDTGAFGNLMSPETAREVTKVYSDARTTVKGVSGTVTNVFSADQATLQFGHLRQQNLNIVTIDLSNVSRGAGTEVSGILGFSVLRFLQIKIDYRDGLVDFVYDPNRIH